MIRWNKNVIVTFCVILIAIFKIFPWIFSPGKKYALQKKVSQDFLIKTPGCTIPNYIENIKYIEPKDEGIRCGERVVQIDRVSDHKIKFRIDKEMGGSIYNLTCGYTELRDFTNDTKGILSRIVPFTDGQVIRIQNEITIFVICSIIPPNELKNRSEIIPPPVYTDFYVVLKRKRKKKSNNRAEDSKKRWSVLMIGMEYMSRRRVYGSMPKLVKYFQKEDWLDFRAFHKVRDNNTILPLLSGDKFNKKLCKNLEVCRLLFLWHKYEKSGYTTAMGEDVTSHNSLFVEMARYNFTDHYLKMPMYQKGNFKCYGQISTGEQLLNYALQFAKIYKKEKCFGLFWSRSYNGIGSNGIRTRFQNALLRFLRSLRTENLLSNTFVIFFGDQGLKYGQAMFTKEGYYDNRLPALFLWVPYNFRFLHRDEYKNLILNQNRIVTHYDLNVLLENILQFSDSTTTNTPEVCKTCVNMLEVIPPERTCSDASIDSTCTCHDMTVPSNDDGSKQSIFVALSEITRRLSAAKYKTPNAICKPLTFNRVLRNHSYKLDRKRYFVTIGIFDSDVAFESVVVRSGREYRLISLHSLTELDNEICVNDDDPVKEFCVCKEFGT